MFVEAWSICSGILTLFISHRLKSSVKHQVDAPCRRLSGTVSQYSMKKDLGAGLTGMLQALEIVYQSQLARYRLFM